MRPVGIGRTGPRPPLPFWPRTRRAGSFRPRRERCARCSREGCGSGGGGTDPRAHGAIECAHAGLARAALGGEAVGPFLGRKGCGSTTLATGWAFPPRIRARGSWVVLRWYCHGRSVARDGVWLGWVQRTGGVEDRRLESGRVRKRLTPSFLAHTRYWPPRGRWRAGACDWRRWRAR